MSNSPADCSEIFECRMCGDCCKGYGGTYMTEQDVKAIADYVGTDTQTFLSKYCRFSGGRPVLVQKKNGYCVFFDELCTIHPVKPRMCKQWPFINSVLVDVTNWQIMAGMCPGIRKDVSDSMVKECVKESLINRWNKER